jgi:protein phosphatase
MQNIITRALGTEPTVEADLEDFMAMPGDVLLLCSDGLTRHVSDEEIAKLVRDASDLRQAATLLVQAARDGGGEDNITCLLLRFVAQAWHKKLGKMLFRGRSPQWQNSI